MRRRNRIMVPMRRVRPRRRHQKSSGQWFGHSQLLFSKVDLCDAEKVWFAEFAPHVEIEYKQVANFQSMPRYKKGLWDGFAYHVTFEERDLELARKFQELWLSAMLTRCPWKPWLG
jgi:hypothetical protein